VRCVAIRCAIVAAGRRALASGGGTLASGGPLVRLGLGLVATGGGRLAIGSGEIAHGGGVVALGSPPLGGACPAIRHATAGTPRAGVDGDRDGRRPRETTTAPHGLQRRYSASAA